MTIKELKGKDRDFKENRSKYSTLMIRQSNSFKKCIITLDLPLMTNTLSEVPSFIQMKVMTRQEKLWCFSHLELTLASSILLQEEWAPQQSSSSLHFTTLEFIGLSINGHYVISNHLWTSQQHLLLRSMELSPQRIT